MGRTTNKSKVRISDPIVLILFATFCVGVVCPAVAYMWFGPTLRETVSNVYNSVGDIITKTTRETVNPFGVADTVKKSFVNRASTTGGCNTANDPQPSGGALCTVDLDCNSINRGGVCNRANANGTCVCTISWGNPDCSYQRLSKDLVGGLQLGLLYVWVAGVGNFMIGRIGPAVAQLLLWFLPWLLLCIACCVFICAELAGGVAMVVAVVIIVACILASFIWSIVDGAFMLQCVYPDANGYALF